MPEIRQLPPSVVNKIAAGEVIERPASVVKELMENALDAGAQRVDVAVEQGGLELVRVSDDGCGVTAEQLPLAVASHATSKIEGADDLFRVRTLGFRGEALASIAEISRLTFRSRVAENAAGAQLDMHGGQSQGISPCGCPVGTTVEVRDLFYNTPVRRKFQRTTQTEMGHVTEAFTRLALAHPERRFTLTHNGRALYDLPPTDDLRGRVGAFFEAELARDLIPVESRDGDLHLAGYVAHPTHSRSHARMQYLFLNNRAIRDRSLQHALSEAYRGLLLTGRYPIAFLHIGMPVEMVDVNVHPTKLEVRFQDSGRIYSQLLGTLRTRFLSTNLNSRLDAASAGGAEGEARDAAAAHDPAQADAMRRELVDWAKGQLAAQIGATPRPHFGGDYSPQHDSFTRARQAPLELTRLDRETLPSFRSSLPERAATDSPHAETAASSPASTAWTATAPAMQAHNRYLITESDDGLVVIDQHALHERILYEQLREKILAGSLESQSLLVPEPVDLAPAEAAAVLEARDVLARLGVTVEPFGGDTVLVVSYPAMLANVSPSQMLRDLVELLLAGGKAPEARDLIDEILHMISCKAAIKAGDRLTPDEVDALLRDWRDANDSHHCPHGRPTALVFTRADLDRQFKRT